MRIFGKGAGKLPQPVSFFTAVCDPADARNVTLIWPKNPGVTGYNIRFGWDPTKLYLDDQVFNTNSLAIHRLNKLKDYYFAVDAFHENGITKGVKTVKASISGQ